MKFQFSIRDLLMIVAIFALAAGWWIDHQRINRLAVQKWEYEAQPMQDLFVPAAVLDKRGDQGWELCGVGGGSNQSVLYYKRPKQQ